MYVTKSSERPEGSEEEEGKEIKVLSKLDKDIKTKLVLDAISIVRSKPIDSSNTFRPIYSSDDDP
jgi:hypothetical protein